LIHHSDRGSQYVSIRYGKRLIEAGATASVGSVPDSYDNAMAEALNGSFKAELGSSFKGPGATLTRPNVPSSSASASTTPSACTQPSTTSRPRNSRLSTTDPREPRTPPENTQTGLYGSRDSSKIPSVPGLVGRPRRRPGTLLADRGYDHDKYRRLVRAQGIKPVIARRGAPHGSGLGVHRWVVERTIAWLHDFRRLRIRWERRDDIHEAFLGLATCLITHRHVQRLC
ncbi:transposase, partial [Streptomyces sp. NPDC015127]|uniref:transposase n=1 Tax=Streptomyces sp. NPDC015127 TaxID=3364939 RepID=UPI0036FA0DFC